MATFQKQAKLAQRAGHCDTWRDVTSRSIHISPESKQSFKKINNSFVKTVPKFLCFSVLALRCVRTCSNGNWETLTKNVFQATRCRSAAIIMSVPLLALLCLMGMNWERYREVSVHVCLSVCSFISSAQLASSCRVNCDRCVGAGEVGTAARCM